MTGVHFVIGLDMSDPRITTIAAAHNVTSYQVCLRWIVQQDCLLAFSSTQASHDLVDEVRRRAPGSAALCLCPCLRLCPGFAMRRRALLSQAVFGWALTEAEMAALSAI